MRWLPFPSEGLAVSSILTDARLAFRRTRWARDEELTLIAVASSPASPEARPRWIVRKPRFAFHLSVALAST